MIFISILSSKSLLRILLLILLLHRGLVSLEICWGFLILFFCFARKGYALYRKLANVRIYIDYERFIILWRFHAWKIWINIVPLNYACFPIFSLRIPVAHRRQLRRTNERKLLMYIRNANGDRVAKREKVTPSNNRARFTPSVKSSSLDGKTNRNWNPGLMTRIVCSILSSSSSLQRQFEK